MTLTVLMSNVTKRVKVKFISASLVEAGKLARNGIQVANALKTPRRATPQADAIKIFIGSTEGKSCGFPQYLTDVYAFRSYGHARRHPVF